MDVFPTIDIDTLYLRSHAECLCRDYEMYTELYAYSLDILCLMALTEALGLEYGDYTSTENAASPGK